MVAGDELRFVREVDDTDVLAAFFFFAGRFEVEAFVPLRFVVFFVALVLVVFFFVAVFFFATFFFVTFFPRPLALAPLSLSSIQAFTIALRSRRRLLASATVSIFM